jgi:hypothetical protein
VRVSADDPSGCVGRRFLCVRVRGSPPKICPGTWVAGSCTGAWVSAYSLSGYVGRWLGCRYVGLCRCLSPGSWVSGYAVSTFTPGVIVGVWMVAARCHGWENDRSVERDNMPVHSGASQDYSLYALHLAVPSPWGSHPSQLPEEINAPRKSKDKISTTYTTRENRQYKENSRCPLRFVVIGRCIVNVQRRRSAGACNRREVVVWSTRRSARPPRRCGGSGCRGGGPGIQADADAVARNREVV